MNGDEQRDRSITELLATSREDETHREELVRRVIPDLKAIAHRALRRRPGSTLQTTELVSEVWLRLFGRVEASWQDRVHFFAIASRAMREILVDRARVRLAQKRGGDWQRISLGAVEPGRGDAVLDVLDLDDALRALAEVGHREARIAELRLFGGLALEEIAAALEISESTVKREWRLARAWLMARLGDG